MADRLFYATPSGRHPTLAYVKSMRDMEMGCRTFERGRDSFAFTCGPVQMARTRIADQAVNDGYDFLVMHDDDLWIEAGGPGGNPLDVWHALFDQHPEVGAIGAVYLRERPMVPTVTVAHEEHPEECCHVISGFPFQPVEVATVATGFMMIRVSALKATRDDLPWFRFAIKRTFTGSVSEVGEDYDFCTRLRAAGFKVLADPRFRTVHMKDTGPLTFSWQEDSWKDDSPTLKEQAAALRGAVGATEVRYINGFVALDHVPQLLADAQAKAERKEAA